MWSGAMETSRAERALDSRIGASLAALKDTQAICLSWWAFPISETASA